MPWLQRWLNPDPAGDVDGLNLYRMVRNNPVRWVDRDGLAPTPDKNNPLVPARPPIPPRPASLVPAVVRPAIPPRPVRPLQLSAQSNQISQATVVAPKRPPPPIVLPTADKPKEALPSYAASSLAVGSHQLMLTSSGSVVSMRADNRTPEQIRTAGGFFPRDNRGPQNKQEFRQAVVTKGINTQAQEHVRNPIAGYVSTGMNEESGGYGDTRDYLYRMEIPGLREQAINDQTLGLGSPFKFTPKGRLDTRLLMSGDTLDQSDFVAMIPPMTAEMTFITPIPNAYIVASRKLGSDQWEPFH